MAVVLDVGKDDYVQLERALRGAARDGHPTGRFYPRGKRAGQHPVLASIRAIGEDVAVRAAANSGRDVVDVGGNAVRHRYHNPGIFARMQFMIPVLQDGDRARLDLAMRLCPDRVIRQPLSLENVHLIGHLAPIFVHSVYYMSGDTMRALLGLCGHAWSVHHVFEGEDGEFRVKHPAKGGHRAVDRLEGSWKMVDGLVEMQAKGNNHLYRHPRPVWDGVVHDELLTIRFKGRVWLVVERLSLATIVPQIQPRDPKLDKLTTKLAAAPVTVRTSSRYAYEIMKHAEREALSPDEARAVFSQATREASALSLSMQQVLAANFGGFWDRVRASLVGWLPMSSGMSAAYLHERLTVSLQATIDNATSGAVWVSNRTLLYSFAMVGLTGAAYSVGAGAPFWGSAAWCSEALRRAQSFVRMNATPCMYDWRLHRVALDTVCAQDVPDHPSVTMIQRECTVGHNFACQPYGLGLPAEVSVYHNCPRVQKAAIIKRVIVPYKAVPEPAWYGQHVLDTSVLMRRLYPRALIPDVTVWLTQYTGAKLVQKTDGTLATGPITQKRSGMPKRELTGKPSLEDCVPGVADANQCIGLADPRWITSGHATLSACFGPAMWTYSKMLRETYDGSRDDLDYARVVYAVGYNADELGALRTRGENWIRAAGPWSEEDSDFSRYDAHIQEWQNQHEVNALAQVVHVPDLALLRTDLASTFVSTKFLTARWRARRRSGDDGTTVFNTSKQRRFWLLVCARVHTQHPAARFYILVGGDDGSQMVTSSALPDFIQVALATAIDFGWALEFSAHGATPGFYSGYWCPTPPFMTALGLSTWRLSPKPGRAWIKASWCRHEYAAKNLRKWAYTNAQGSAAAWLSTPVLRVFARARRDERFYDERFVRTHDPYQGCAIHEIDWAFWEQHYGTTRDAIEEFERAIGPLTEQNVVYEGHKSFVRKLVAESGFAFCDDERPEPGAFHRRIHVPHSQRPRFRASPNLSVVVPTVLEELALTMLHVLLGAQWGLAGGVAVLCLEVPRTHQILGLPGVLYKLGAHACLAGIRYRSPAAATFLHMLHNVCVVGSRVAL